MERVNHPSHYALPNGLEALDIARYLDFNLGNAVKYIVRAGKKTEEGISADDKKLEDLKKAVFYLNDEINMLKKQYDDYVDVIRELVDSSSSVPKDGKALRRDV